MYRNAIIEYDVLCSLGEERGTVVPGECPEGVFKWCEGYVYVYQWTVMPSAGNLK